MKDISKDVVRNVIVGVISAYGIRLATRYIDAVAAEWKKRRAIR